ncbi:YniB family protein [Photorhabdus australis]|uniref:YniB family protein n=1 Tax=Photorhabdus australis TaxID=286156 RepID=UPI00055DFC0C|nr:YniB family protein [Photorhabdus australis]
MTYQKAGYIAMMKRILGWVIFIPALVSTTVSVINLVWQHGIRGDGINAVLDDFLKMMAEMVRFNTPFLDFFWKNSPTPDRLVGFTGSTFGFLTIYFLIFIGLAMRASGQRMYRQVKFIRENIEDQLILEKAKGNNGLTREQIESKIKLPHHTLFSQIYILYISPIIVGVTAYFILEILGW